MRGIICSLIILAGCGAPSMPTPSPTGAAVSSTPLAPIERLTGEVVFDGAWPSEHRDGCLSLTVGSDFIELVTSDDWFMGHDPDAGWFEIRDDADHLLIQEHRLATLTGRFLDAPGCREGALFEVSGFEPPPPTAATLWVEVVGGIGSAEGSVNVVRVMDPEGMPLLQQPVDPGGHMRIPAGPIRLVDYQKSCDANCSTAYGSDAECMTDLDAKPGDEITLSVLLSSEPPDCELILREGKPADLVGTIEVSPFDSAVLPYEGLERCVHVAGSAVPVLPEGWRIVMLERQPDRFELAFVDPSGSVVARDGDIVWLNGTASDEGPPFGCDHGTRFDVTDVVKVRAIAR